MVSDIAQGPDLSSVRQRLGITVEEIARTTKISPYYLQAIEAGQYDRLPGGIYNTSYIRQYARAVALDEKLLLRYYYDRTPFGGSPLAAAASA